MRKFLLIGFSTIALMACQVDNKTKEITNEISTQVSVPNEKLQLNEWLNNKFYERVRRYPQYLAGLGIKERMTEWNDPSYEFALKELEIISNEMNEIKVKFNFDSLADEEKLSYRLFLENSQNSLDQNEWWYHDYALTQMYGAHSGVPTFLINQHPIDNIADANAYIKRIELSGNYLEKVLENTRESARKGIRPPRFVYGHVISTSRNIIRGFPFEKSDKLNLVYDDFNKKIFELSLPKEVSENLKKQAQDALQGSFKPAYILLINEMLTQQKLTTEDDGVWKLPRGNEYYASRLKAMTKTELSAKEIHQIGLDEVDRIHEEMRAIMSRVGFESNLQDFFKYLKDEPRFTYPDTDAGREDYIKEATRIIETISKRLDEVFLKLPKAKLEVRRVEAFREKTAGKAFYSRGTPDGSRPGYYYANLNDINDMPKYQMEALAYHEGNPGHHMQLSISQELSGVPEFRKHNSVTAYTEGWGLYSEFFPKEMGFYDDPYSDFGRLAMELWRAARLVVDTGIHDKKWTRTEAIDYLLANTPNPKNDCEKAIERYIVMPGQATAYKIGMMKILELRENAKEKLQEKFDIRSFHDTVINSGPVPLNILEERVDSWINKELKS
ncbi:MAG: DUF885 domain-containing protein [Hellea sp.]|nr:DUF885 domain-containing protein [Hellea sp.]